MSGHMDSTGMVIDNYTGNHFNLKKIICSIFIIIILFILINNRSFGYEGSFSDDNYLERSIVYSTWYMYMNDTRHTGQSQFGTEKNIGTLQWKYNYKEKIAYSPVMDKNGDIFLTFNGMCKNLSLIIMNLTFNWIYSSNSKIIISPNPAIDKENHIIVCSFNYSSNDHKNSSLYAFNKDSSVFWEFRINGIIMASPIIDENGIIYTCSY